MLKLKGGGFKNKENKTLVEFAGNFSPYVLEILFENTSWVKKCKTKHSSQSLHQAGSVLFAYGSPEVNHLPSSGADCERNPGFFSDVVILLCA